MTTDEIAAQWWARRLDDQHADKREAFAAALAHELTTNWPDWNILRVDYDPDVPLQRALDAAGIDCRGFLFSAQAILPSKTMIARRPDGTIEGKDGYGAEWLPVA